MANKNKRWFSRCATTILFVSVTLSCISAECADITVRAPSNSDATHHLIRIPSLNVAEALNLLAEQTEALFMFPYDIAESRSANSVTGEYTIMEALDIILQDSGLASDLSQKGVIEIYVSDNAVDKNEERRLMNTRKNLLTATISFFVGAGGHGATAQGSAEIVNGRSEFMLEEIIVTAQKREESITDVPSTVNVVAGQSLSKFAIFNFKDIEQLTPGVTLDISSTGTNDTISMRGITFSPESNASAAVDVYWNDLVVQSSVGFQQMFDLERIEILRGPQGALNGRSSPAGAIKSSLKNPA
jgi:TonB-dependent Receptor Plug Domain